MLSDIDALVSINDILVGPCRSEELANEPAVHSQQQARLIHSEGGDCIAELCRFYRSSPSTMQATSIEGDNSPPPRSREPMLTEGKELPVPEWHQPRNLWRWFIDVCGASSHALLHSAACPYTSD